MMIYDILTAPETSDQTAPLTALEEGKIRVRINGNITAMIDPDNKGLALVRSREVRGKVRTESKLLLLVSNTEVSSKVSTQKALFKLVSIKEVATLVATENRLLILVSTRVSTEKALYKWIPLAEINNGEIRGRTSTVKRLGIVQAYQKMKSYLWQAIDISNYFYNEDAFSMVEITIQMLNSYHQKNDNVTKTMTSNLYRNSKSFTKVRKVFLIFRHVREALAKPANYLLFWLIFSRQAFLTQAEKLLFSALTIASICSSKSSSKRIMRRVLLLRSYLLFLFSACIGIAHYKYGYHKKQSPEVLATHSRDLTKPLNGVMIMANRYDSAPLRAEQSKVFKFYNTLTAQVVQTIATNDAQARVKLHSNNLAFISRKPLTTGVYHA